MELRSTSTSAVEWITAGQGFGAAALAAGKDRRQSTAVAVEPCRLLKLVREQRQNQAQGGNARVQATPDPRFVHLAPAVAQTLNGR